MIVVVGSIRVPGEELDGLLEPMAAVIKASRAESGCISYSFGLDPSDPGLIHISEEWESREALDKHAAQPHMGPWREALAEAGILDRDLTVYQAGAGEPL